jgi:hypothetical protein
MDADRLITLARNSRSIPGIHNYCDGWCERCRFTDRCLQYAMHSGPPDVPEDGKHERLSVAPIVQAGHAYVGLVGAWFDAERRSLFARADQLVARADCAENGHALVHEAVRVKDALQVIAHDRPLIPAKLLRAVRARVVGLPNTNAAVEPAVSNEDSNGSAKVALIAIDRSEVAWRHLAQWMDGSATAVLLADTLAQLRTRVEFEFPAARRFVRPGFDQPSL